MARVIDQFSIVACILNLIILFFFTKYEHDKYITTIITVQLVPLRTHKLEQH